MVSSIPHAGTRHRYLAGFIAFKATWLLLVLGQARWLAVAAVLVALQFALCLPLSRGPALRRALALVAIAACGIALDTVLLQVGLLRFADAALPAWLWLLWLAFACLLALFHEPLRRAPPVLLALAGAAAGVIGYGAGALLGAVAFGTETVPALALLALPWCGLLPLARRIFAVAEVPVPAARTLALLVPALLFGAAGPGSTAAGEASWLTLGEGRYSVFMLPLYTARLEVAGEPFEFPSAVPFRLTLRYHRAVAPERIVQATREQWQAQGVAAPQAWLASLQSALPAIARDDELTLQVAADYRAELLHNGRTVARFDDAAFTRAFAGIWLAPNTTAPQLRRQLLGEAS